MAEELKPHVVIRIVGNVESGYAYTMFGTTFLMPYKIPVGSTTLGNLIDWGLEMDLEGLEG